MPPGGGARGWWRREAPRRDSPAGRGGSGAHRQSQAATATEALGRFTLGLRDGSLALRPPQPPLRKGGRQTAAGAPCDSPPCEGGVGGGVLRPGPCATHGKTAVGKPT